MTYSSASDAAIHCPVILGSASTFSEDTKPTLAAVTAFMTRGYALINTRLSAAGYDTPVGTAAAVYPVLADLESLYTAARAQGARMSSRVQAKEVTKGDKLMEQFNNELKALLSTDLSRAGATLSSQGVLYAGGISQGDKDDVESDSDRVAPRFKRDMFRVAGTARPSGPVDDEESD